MAIPFLSFYPTWGRHLGWIPFFAITPLASLLLCSSLSQSPSKRAWNAFFCGWISGVVFFTMTLSWISSVAWEGVLLLPPFLALYFGLWALFVVMVVRPLFLTKEQPTSLQSLGAVLLAAAGWVGVEWLRGTLFTGFGWNSFGVSFYGQLPLIQVADITGVAGLSFLAVMTGSMTALAWQRLLRQKKWEPFQKNLCHLHLDVAFVLVAVLAVFIYGVGKMMHHPPLEEQLSIAAVQGNIPQNHKWDRVFEEEIMNVYKQETQLAIKTHPDLVVWPEAAMPRPLLNDDKIFSQVNQLVEEGHFDLLTGSLDYEENPQRDYNAAILLNPAGMKPQLYAKTHLVPFGEYIPCRKTFPLFEWVVGKRVLGDFDAGPGPKVLYLTTKPIGIAPLICFEDTLGNLVRHFALQRAQLLITLTNDGWFGRTIASQQHAMNALFRAVETKLPLLRVANTGVTCVVDPYGRMTQILTDAHGSTFFEGVLFAQLSLPRDPTPTFYTEYGDWFSYFCLGLIAVGILSIFLRKNKLIAYF